jgi:hypothetical protein
MYIRTACEAIERVNRQTLCVAGFSDRSAEVHAQVIHPFFSDIHVLRVSLYVVYSVFSPFSSATLSSFLTSSFVVVATTTTTHDGIGIAALHQAHQIL